MNSLSRSSMAAISVIFLAMGSIFVNPSAFQLDLASELFYFFAILLAYIGSSMLYINYSFRQFVLGNRLKTHSIDTDLSRMWKEVEKRFPTQTKDVDLLKYYFEESLRGFLEGDFEKSFIWGYNVIREKTVVNPIEFIDDKRHGKTSFGEIRNTLMHSRREGHTEASKIRRIKRNLFNDCADLLEREYDFIKAVSSIPS